MIRAGDIPTTALAFRGYDVKNLGRTPELLQIPAYRDKLIPVLRRASEKCSEVLGRPVDLLTDIEAGREFSIDHYGEAIAMIVAVEQGQLQILRDCHGIEYRDAAFSFGFSLGEIAALVAGGTFDLGDALQVPLVLTPDAIELAREVTLGIVFSLKEALSFPLMEKTLVEVNQLGQGVAGISTYLSPNSVLVMGTGATMDKIKERLEKDFPAGTHLRCNESLWPPIHTPIIHEKNFPSRVARHLHTIPTGFGKPRPDILSLVTARFSYNDYNAREHMVRWSAQPQLLWEGVCRVLRSPVKTIIHVGPAPNIIPSTFQRLSKNLQSQIAASVGMRALASAADRPWLQKMLPEKAFLLRAPGLKHVILEDWLLEHASRAADRSDATSEV